jgi:serine/threonine protein kinase
MGQLNSAYIVGYVDAFIHESRVSIVMEYCENGDLESYIRGRQEKPLPESEIWRLFI